MTLYIDHDERNNIRIILGDGKELVVDRLTYSYYFIRELFVQDKVLLGLDSNASKLEGMLE